MFYVLARLSSEQALIPLAGVGRCVPLSSASFVSMSHAGRQGDCPVTEDISDRLLRFPFFTGMSSSEQSQVIDAVSGFNCQPACDSG
jgi:dTDP-4-amino-4,6-dideoxygalactose transaminase